MYYLCGDILDEVTELLGERLLFELERRIVKPYLDPVALSKKMTQWTGVNGNSVNNWNPWIISNVLTVCAVTVTDNVTFEKEGSVMFSYLCDEAPSEVTVNSFILYRRCVTFDPSLQYVCEPLDKTWLEVENIPGRWDVDVLYRIMLSASLAVSFANVPAGVTLANESVVQEDNEKGRYYDYLEHYCPDHLALYYYAHNADVPEGLNEIFKRSMKKYVRK